MSRHAITYSHLFDELKFRRLENWGLVARQDPCRPKGAVINHLYTQMIPDGEDDGYGEITGDTVVVEQAAPAKAEVELDHGDAEVIGKWIILLSQGHRATLAQRYVVRIDHVCKDRVDAAIRALEQRMTGGYPFRP